MQRYLVLEDGTTYRGTAFGADQAKTGEVVFTTGMTGYQEAITDQSFANQILVFTNPLIGNYGVNLDDDESLLPEIKGVVCRKLARVATNWRMQDDLANFLTQRGIPGLEGIDTRALVKKLRQHGTLRGRLVDDLTDLDQVVAALKQATPMKNIIPLVSTKSPYPNPGTKRNIVVVDFGLKNGILRELSRRKCNITVLPYTATVDQIMRLDPDGVVLSSGPGDPHSLKKSVLKMIQELQERVPLFGIGLGHELFAMANGVQVDRVPVEIHGMNHPIKEIITDHVVYANQGAGFQIQRESVNRENLFVTYVDMLTGAVQGLRHRRYPAFSVQFFPDGSPGPDETDPLFDEFMEMTRGTEED